MADNQSDLLPICHVGLVGTHDLSRFDKCIAAKPHMNIRVVHEESSSTTRTFKLILFNPNFTVGTLKLYVASDPKDLDKVPCNVLVINITDSEPYYGSELNTAQEWTDHIRSVRGNDHKVVVRYVQYDSADLPDCMVKDSNCVIYFGDNDPMRIIAKIWRAYLGTHMHYPVLHDPRPDELATIRVNIARFDKSYDVPTILTHVVADNKYVVYKVPAETECINVNTHVYEIGTINGQITMTFTENTGNTDPNLRVMDDVLMVVVSRHGLVSEQFKRYMDTECDVTSAESVFICTMPDDNCTDPECVIKCTKHISTAFNKFVRRFNNVDGVVQLVMNEQSHWNPPLLQRIIHHNINDGNYQDSLMVSYRY